MTRRQARQYRDPRDTWDDEPEHDPRERGDDDGREYGDPRDAIEDHRAAWLED